ncbi:MAG: EutN/CcmL family microcompartment protein [Clostridiaceae bacterium]|nr:EutN/CcmL family microcompartment protein [Clostridiaceae bacterium]
MHLGKVIGTVVATRKDETLTGCKLMAVQPLNVTKQPIGEVLIAVDTVGAGISEIIIYTKGTAARYGASKPQSCIDAAIVGIVDHVDICADEE